MAERLAQFGAVELGALLQKVKGFWGSEVWLSLGGLHTNFFWCGVCIPIWYPWYSRKICRWHFPIEKGEIVKLLWLVFVGLFNVNYYDHLASDVIIVGFGSVWRKVAELVPEAMNWSTGCWNPTKQLLDSSIFWNFSPLHGSRKFPLKKQHIFQLGGSTIN